MRRLLLALILLLGFSLRFMCVHWGLPSKSGRLYSYNPDESAVFNTISKWGKTVSIARPTMPFLIYGGFYLTPIAGALKLAQVTGLVHIGSRQWLEANLPEADRMYLVGRWISLICGVLAILMAFLLAEACYGASAGLLAAFLMATCPDMIMYSILIKPDMMMIAFALTAWWLGVKERWVLSGLVFGLAIATKISAAPFPLLVLLFAERKGKVLAYLSGFTVLGFFIASPYFALYPSMFKVLWNYAHNPWCTLPIYETMYGHGLIANARYYLPWAMGAPLLIMSAVAAIALYCRKDKSKFDAALIFSAFIFYIAYSFMRTGATNYILPVVPLLFIILARCFFMIKKIWFYILFPLAVVFALRDSGYLIKQLHNKNNRELASEWIDRNIPKGGKVLTVNFSYMLPAALRKYHCDYKVLGAEGFDFLDSLAAFKNMESTQADYLFIADAQIRDYLNPKLDCYFHEQAITIRRMLAGYKEVAQFQGAWGDEPEDWVCINNGIRIYRIGDVVE